jgi:hypothetical protein
MSQGDPPRQGEREAGRFRFFQPWEAAVISYGQSPHFGPVGLQRAEPLEAGSHPNLDEGKIGDPPLLRRTGFWEQTATGERFFCQIRMAASGPLAV